MDLKLSHSAMQLYQQCPRKYYYQRVEKWAPRTEALALIRGSAIHSALDHFFKTKNKKEAHDLAQDVVASKEIMPQEREAIIPIITTTLEMYFQDQEIDEMQVLQSEVELRRPLVPGAYYMGKIDTIVSFRGIEFLRETKTTTQVSSNWEQKYSLDNQTLGYLWLLEGKIPGIILDLIRIPDGKKTKYPEFVRSSYFPHPSLLQEWENERKALATLILHDVTFPKNTSACFDYNRACDFFPFCSKSISEKEMPNFFTKREISS